MGKVHLLQSNFTGGEIDPKLKGRVDIPRYQHGLDTMLNAYTLITGGGTRRPGTRFIEAEGALTVRAIPFKIFRYDLSPPALQGYLIEFRSDDTIHFYTNNARIGTYSIASPFTGADLSKIRYEQFDNVLYLVHPDFAPQQLVRTTDTNWTISAATFIHPPDNSWSSIAYGNGLYVAVAYSGSGNRVMTSPDAVTWRLRGTPADNNWTSVCWNGSIFVAVADTGIGDRVMTSPDGINWTLRASPADNNWRAVVWTGSLFVAVAGSGTGNRVMTSPDGVTWTLRTSAADNSWTALSWNGSILVAVAATGTGNRVMTSPDGITWTIRTSAADNGWRGVAWNGTVFAAVSDTGTSDRVMTSPDGITWTSRTSAADNNWAAITWNGTLFVAVAYSGTGNRVMTSPDGTTWTIRTSAADSEWHAIVWAGNKFVVVADIALTLGKRVMTSSDGITWTAKLTPSASLWDADSGYPSAITFFEQRMILAGTKTYPQSVFGSETGNIFNFAYNTGDSDPFFFTLSAASSNIVNLAATKMIIVSTADKEMYIKGGIEKPLTPTNSQTATQTNYGGKDNVKPLVIGSEFLFATKHGKKLRSLTYDILQEAYKAPDISLVSGHLVSSGIVEMAWATEPSSIVWIVTTDGKLLSLTYDKDQDIVAWAQHTTDGLFKGVAVIPYNDTDQVWVVVERTVNGTSYTYLEVLDDTLNTDAAVTGVDSTGKATWTGLTHLEGKTVDILADGAVMPQQTVTGGQITLPRIAYAVEIGLNYRTTMKDLRPELPTGIGTAQGQAASCNRATIRLYDSAGCTINGQIVPFRKFGNPFTFKDIIADGTYTAGGEIYAGGNTVNPVLFTGDKSVSLNGWGAKGVITIEQTQPLPLTVLAVIKEVTING